MTAGKGTQGAEAREKTSSEAERSQTARPVPATPDEDGRLMERYRDGETACFDSLVQRHQGPVFRFFLRHVGDVETAEDLTQETFIRVVHNRATFRSGAKFTTWIYTIARNLSVDEMRKRRYRRHRSLDEPLGRRDGDPGRTLGDLVGDPQAKTDMQAGDLEMRTVLEAAIGKLPKEQREVFALREMSGLSFQEIAEIVGCNENTVKSRMRYALERLHAALSGRVEETGE
ncbi:MAG: RNA polymerase sigma factor [Deltaproteobacteria bacterium]|nr:RNA polymerase sigma factor [Deltaproteobacteria bacterium]